MEKSWTPAVARIEKFKGIPRLYINGKLTPPVCYLPSAVDWIAQQDTEEMVRAAQAGVNLVVVPWATFDFEDRDAFVTRLKNAILSDSSLSKNPKAFIILRMDCNFSPEEIGCDDGERLIVNDGQRMNMASLASVPWHTYAKKRMRMIAEHVKSDPLLNAYVVGYELLGGDTGEWFGPGYWSGHLDVSEPNRKAFCRFLRDRYGCDSALQQAWDDPNASIDKASIPAFDRLPGIYTYAAHRDYVRSGQSLIDRPTNRHMVDYLDYTNDLRAEYLIGLTKEVKEACDGEKLAMVYYGYQADCYTASSNHFGMSKLLTSPDIDVLSGPVSYQDRNEGGIGAFMGMADAVTAAGKLWIDEGDYRSPVHVTEPGLPYPPTAELLDQILRREMGKCMVHNAGVWWLSFNQGWFNYPSFWQHNREMTELMARYNRVKEADTPEVCYILDEKAFSLVGDADATGLKLIRLARSVLYRSGYRFGMYTLADLLSGHIDDAKLYILVDPWRLTSEEAAKAASHLHRPGKVALYMYGYGDTAPEDFRTLTGMTLEKHTGGGGYTPQWDLKKGMDPRLADSTYSEDLAHGITAALAKLALTDQNPVYAVKPTSGVSALGTYIDGPADGEIGFATYTQNGWTSIFFGGLKFSEALLTCAAEQAQVHSYTAPGDVLDADAQFVMLHISDPGEKVVRFPQECDIYAVDQKQWYRGDTYSVSDTYRGQTILLFYGDRKKLESVTDPFLPNQ